ncbi:MAG: ATP-binding SpoIIE family protein phosphatase [Bacteroidota bacterium]
MANSPHIRINIPNKTYQAFARSEIKKIAQEIGFSGNRLGQLEIIVAEHTSNIIKHTLKGGEILVRKIDLGEILGIEIISIDNGPGMLSPLKMMEDGASTSNTLGQGLGAIKRLSDEFDIYSIKGWGTILLSRFYLKKDLLPPSLPIEVKGIMLPKLGETKCGDNWDIVLKGNSLKMCLADGLGHGEHAAEAAVAALISFKATLKNEPAVALRTMHALIKKTRGAVVTIAYLDITKMKLFYCGVGNISGKVIGLRNRSFLSYNGIIGHTIPNTINDHNYDWEENDILIMHSDGLNTRWDMQKYPMILKHDSTILAAALYKDNNRGNDDVTVVVIRKKKKVV